MPPPPGRKLERSGCKLIGVLVAAWLDRVAITSCDVVGHSYGGGVAMWLLLHRAAAVRRLALVAPGGLGHELAFELRLASLPFFTERFGQPWISAKRQEQLLKLALR